jgi:hypothetical protein
MNTNIPDTLMTNVETKLRKHVKDKRKKRYIHKALTAAILVFVLLPGSAFAFAQYNSSILYKQEIDLARKNNNITEVNQIFKYKDVEFTIKEIIADDTGMEVIYDVSDPRYSINKVTFCDKDNEEFTDWGYTLSDLYSTNNEKAFCINMDNNAANYMHNNPVTIQINNIIYSDDKADTLIDKVSSLFNTNDKLNVDWTLKMQIPMQQIKVIPVNKEYSLDIGTLKINSFKVGVLKSVLDYSFVPNDKNISNISPLFSVRLDTEYIMANSSYCTGINEARVSNSVGQPTATSINYAAREGENISIYGTQEFNSIYYKNLDQIGIKLIAVETIYDFRNLNIYKVDKNNLPMEFDCNGEKFEIASIEEKGDSTEYTVEYGKTNRIYSGFGFEFSQEGGMTSENNSETIQFKDQTLRDTIYSSLVKNVPNLTDIDPYGDLQKGATSTKVTIKPGISDSKTTEFTIFNAVKNLIYDEAEVIIHK